MTPPIHSFGTISIWWFAFGYFACYVPYSAMVKALSSGYLTDSTGLTGATILPWSLLVSAVGMLVFLGATGIWRHASRRQIGVWQIPFPSVGPLFSGICTAAIIATTTLAYTFSGISIVFAMLLMRGGVLLIAPVVDAMSGRHVKWFSWVGVLLSLAALFVAFAEKGKTNITIIAAVDIGVYLLAYFIRLRLMSHFAKNDQPEARLRYFAEEQLVAAPVSVVLAALVALWGGNQFAQELARGFNPLALGSAFIWVLAIGLFSQGTGIFGGLILLGKQENTFCVPVNRSSSIIAGIVASVLLTLLFQAPAPSLYKLTSAGLIVGALVFLSRGK